MAQDIKKMFRENKVENQKLSAGHELRFEAKLKKAFSEENFEKPKASRTWLKFAAVAIVLIGMGFFGFNRLSNSSSEVENSSNEMIVDSNSEDNVNYSTQKITLADVSPELKKVAEFYMTGINLQLASLEVTKENKDLVDGYMGQLSELDKDYSALNAELSKVGPTESTINALIDNLKLRLDLLFKLKNKLKELKNQNNDEIKII